MKLINGKKISQEILNGLKEEIGELKPCLGIVLVGNDPGSNIYVQKKEEAAKEVGIKIKKHVLNESVSEKEVLKVVNDLNSDKEVNGILVQMPLPDSISPDRIIQSISPEKDVDGFLPKSKFDQPFILAIERALKETGSMKDKNAVALVNSDIFGSALESKLGIHYRVWVVNPLDDLTEFDIIITALGQPQIIKENMIKENVILIDGGISRKDGKILGDVDRESVEKKASWLTPVPGGLGPMTVSYLLKNVVLSAKL